MEQECKKNPFPASASVVIQVDSPKNVSMNVCQIYMLVFFCNCYSFPISSGISLIYFLISHENIN